MKRICFVELQPFPTTIGGGITHLNELSKTLIKRGYEVSIITSKPNQKFRLDPGLTKLKLYHPGIFHRKLVDFPGIKRLLYYPWRVFFELNFIIGAASILRKEKFDVVDVQSPITTSLPCSLFGIPFYITAHGIHNEGFTKLYKEKGDFFVSNIASSIYNIIEKFNVKRAKKVICLGNDTFDYYKKFNDCVIIPNGIDTKKFASPKTKRNKVIVSVGRFTEQKQVDKLIMAMDSLPDYKLYIIGLGPLETNIREMCKKRKNCIFLGYKSQNEIIPYLQKARFTVLPSLFEGLPIVMLEAMSCGVIPIATSVGDIPSVVKNGVNGFLLKDNSPKEIEKTVRNAEKQDLNKLRDRCSDLIVKKYDWDKAIAKEYLKTWKIEN